MKLPGLLLAAAATRPAGAVGPSAAASTPLRDCRWTDARSGASFDLSPLAPADGHFAFHGVLGDHDSLLAAVGYHKGFELADYIYYLNICDPRGATGFTFDKCDDKEPAAVYQTHKDQATHDDCFSLGAPTAQASLIDAKRPEVGLQLRFEGGDACHKEVHHPKSSRSCEDTPGWRDREGRSCEQYAAQNLCGAAFIPTLASNGVDARGACCASCSGWWSETVVCPALERPENGAAIAYTNLRQWPSLATYSCESGFTLSGGFSKRECGPDGQWKGTPPRCIDEPYYGRGGRMGRYNHGYDGNDGQGEAEPSEEAEVEIEWIHEPRSILVNMTCDRSMAQSWSDFVNMAHRVMPVEAEMCEYVVQWPTQFACPLDEAGKAASQARLAAAGGGGGWLGWLLGWAGTAACVCGYGVLYRDDARDRVLAALPPALASFFGAGGF